MARSLRLKRNPRVFWLRSHRWCGALAAVFVVLLAVTGILINHAHTLGWDHRALKSKWLLSLYGVKMQVPADGAFVEGAWYVQIADHLYREERSVGACAGGLSGVVRVSPEAVAVQCVDALYLLTPEGELIERLDGQPEPMLGIALSGERLLTKGSSSMWVVDMDVGEWSAVAPDVSITWSPLVSIPNDVAERWRLMSAPADLTWERLLLDLHSGRLFGRVGEVVVDIAGLLMVFLAATGVWALLTRPRR